MMLSFVRNRVLVVFILIAFSAATSGCSTIRKHPEFGKRSARIKKISVVEPDIEIIKIVFKGDNETLFKESARAERWAFTSLETEFAKKGYEIKPFEITDEIRQKYPNLEVDLGKLKQKYAAQIGDLKKKKRSNFKLSLGSEINRLADALEVDAFIFAAGSGYIKSEGEVAKDLTKTALIAAATFGTVIVIFSHYGGSMNISVVESDTGDILWNNVSSPALNYNLSSANFI